MGIPTLPKERHRPSFDETMIDLIESIAKEELALSHLITSESHKIKAFVGTELDFPTCPTTTEIMNFNYSVSKLMDTILMKEWLLLKKLETVSHMKTTFKLEGECALQNHSHDNECTCDDECTCENDCSCDDEHHEINHHHCDDRCSCEEFEGDNHE